jgi:hypothetical protein
MIVLIELIQGLYKVRAEWVDDAKLRGTVAVSVSAFNTLMLARHAVLQGYYPEAQGILRDSYEKVTRAWLFRFDDKSVEIFWGGGRLNQVDVDKRIANSYDGPIESSADKEIYEMLRQKYKNMSARSHANLGALAWRTPNLDPEKYKEDPITALGDSVGKDLILGGLLSKDTGRALLSDVTLEAQLALKVLITVAKDQDGYWKEQYASVSNTITAEQEELNKIYGAGSGK